MAEFDYLSIIIPLTVGGAVAMITYLLKGRERKDSVEKKALDKGIIERGMAKELQENAAKIASLVKEETMNAVNQLFTNLKNEIKLETQEVHSSMRARDVRIDGIERAIEGFKIDVYKIIDKFTHSIERLETMNWGYDAKSVPPYMKGKVQSQAHKEEPDTGVFTKQHLETQRTQTKANEERIKREDDHKEYVESEDDKATKKEDD